ncbi:MAG: FxsA family protein [Campylobacteraceae bacterium]|nr:FxsA family protein [Campylobacteraceae bacterium]
MKLILFLFYIFIEVVVTIPLASAIGVFYTFLEILLSAVFGIILLFNTPFKLQESFQRIMQKKLSLSTVSLASTVRILGAFLLILPGFFGDITGAVLLIMSAVLLIGVKRDDEDIIDVEIIDDNSNKSKEDNR